MIHVGRLLMIRRGFASAARGMEARRVEGSAQPGLSGADSPVPPGNRPLQYLQHCRILQQQWRNHDTVLNQRSVPKIGRHYR